MRVWRMSRRQNGAQEGPPLVRMRTRMRAPPGRAPMGRTATRWAVSPARANVLAVSHCTPRSGWADEGSTQTRNTRAPGAGGGTAPRPVVGTARTCSPTSGVPPTAAQAVPAAASATLAWEGGVAGWAARCEAAVTKRAPAGRRGDGPAAPTAPPLPEGQATGGCSAGRKARSSIGTWTCVAEAEAEQCKCDAASNRAWEWESGQKR